MNHDNFLVWWPWCVSAYGIIFVILFIYEPVISSFMSKHNLVFRILNILVRIVFVPSGMAAVAIAFMILEALIMIFSARCLGILAIFPVVMQIAAWVLLIEWIFNQHDKINDRVVKNREAKKYC